MKVVSERREQKWRGPTKRGPRGRERPRWQLCKLLLSFILHFDPLHTLYYLFSVFSIVIAAYGRTQKTARDSGEKGGMTLVCDDEGKKGVASRAVHVRAHAKTENETIVDRSRGPPSHPS